MIMVFVISTESKPEEATVNKQPVRMSRYLCGQHATGQDLGKGTQHCRLRAAYTVSQELVFRLYPTVNLYMRSWLTYEQLGFLLNFLELPLPACLRVMSLSLLSLSLFFSIKEAMLTVDSLN